MQHPSALEHRQRGRVEGREDPLGDLGVGEEGSAGWGRGRHWGGAATGGRGASETATGGERWGHGGAAGMSF